MVGQSLWKNLKTLVSIDKQVGELEKNIEQTYNILEKEEKEIPKLEKKLEQSRHAYLEQKNQVTQQEITAKELKEKEEKEKKILEKSTNEKEYKAAEKELKKISQDRTTHDDKLIKAWHDLESLKAKYEKEKAESEELIKNFTHGIEAQKEAISDSKKQKNEILEKRKDFIKNIPEEWLEKYERMRHKVSDPIVPVLGTSCSACYYSILRQDLSLLKKSGVLPCRNCYRFLYYNEEEEKEAEKARY
jgi:predicted  nucleic acid-binding Zn-ribbon protein